MSLPPLSCHFYLSSLKSKSSTPFTVTICFLDHCSSRAPTIQLFEIFLCWVRCLCFFPSFMGEFPIVFKHFLSFSQLLYCCVNDYRNKRPPITFKILCYAFFMGLLQLSKFPLQLITTSIIFFKLMFLFFFLSCWYIYIQGYPMSNAIDNGPTIHFFNIWKHCTEHGPNHNICVGTDFPSRKAKI